MRDKKSDPPRSAIWFLRHACPGSNNEALAGDLVERFREGRSRGWFWKQVLIAIAVGVFAATRRQWPQVCYAIAGTTTLLLFAHTIQGARHIVPSWVLPWPFSMLVDDLTPDVLLALAALPALAVGLLLNGTFRRVSLLRTWEISILLSAIHLYLVFFVTTGPFLIPVLLWVSVYFFILLVSACVGCWSPRRSTPWGKPAEDSAG